MTDLSLFRVYWDPAEINRIPDHKYEGYPHAWYEQTQAAEQTGLPNDGPQLNDPIKDIVRDEAGHRCLRCGHPYQKGLGEWSPCDVHCAHLGPVRFRELYRGTGAWVEHDLDLVGQVPGGDTMYDEGPNGRMRRWEYEARWRILTVHHLNGVKADCRWWNLVSLCQRCHLTIQAKVHMQRPWYREHTEWFKPYAAGFYAATYKDWNLTREETMANLETLLSLEAYRQMELS